MGSRLSVEYKSTNINNKPVLEMCCKNLIPSPAPSEAPSIKPGISAITKLESILLLLQGEVSV